MINDTNDYRLQRSALIKVMLKTLLQRNILVFSGTVNVNCVHSTAVL